LYIFVNGLLQEIPTIFIEIGSYLTDPEQQISLAPFSETQCKYIHTQKFICIKQTHTETLKDTRQTDSIY